MNRLRRYPVYYHIFKRAVLQAGRFARYRDFLPGFSIWR